MEPNARPASSGDDSPPVAVVTGAGSGIGRATAIMLAREGYRLVLVGRDMAKLDGVAGEIAALASSAVDPKHTPSAISLPVDLSTPAACQSVIDKAVGVMGGLDVLINNAGWSPLTPIPEMDAATAQRIFEINALAPVWLTLAACRHLAARGSTVGRGGPGREAGATGQRPRRWACIVNVSSRASTDPFAGLGVYGAAKAAVNLLSLAVARECPGVRSFAVAPGAVETPLLRSIFPASVVPPDRCLSPDDVARVILDCVLGAYDHENGRTIEVPSP